MSEINEINKNEMNQQSTANSQPTPIAQAVGSEGFVSNHGGEGQSIWDSALQPRLSAGTDNPMRAQAPLPDTEETKRMKENFGFFGPATFLYAVFYAFCMYKNGSGVTFPFFAAGSLLFLYFSLSKLETTLKKGSVFYMAVIVLLGISTFCTDDSRLIFFNKLGIFLLMMSLLLKQFFDTSQWKLGKYLCCICRLVFASFGELGRPFADFALYRKGRKSESSKRVWYFLLGLIIGIPVFFAVLFLLASADAVFRELTGDILGNINPGNSFNMTCRVVFLFLSSYCLTSYLCKRRIKEQVADRRKGEPIVAITITGLLTVLYLLFCAIQIGSLFLGRMRLPLGYTYAKYAREGFFQLLAVSLLNLVIVLVCMSFFRESRLLKGVLTAMSLCTFVMIASSALRMVIYIRFYYLTFLRILVLWSLAVLTLLFAGIVISIFKEKFPLFHYSVVVVSVLYLALSFAHPDYLIAKVNVGNAAHNQMQWYSQDEAESFSREDLFGGEFFLASEAYHDYHYLIDLSADAAPVLVPYLKELGYRMEAFDAENALTFAEEEIYGENIYRSDVKGFGYYWMSRMQYRVEEFGIRTFNVSRFRMMQSFKATNVTTDVKYYPRAYAQIEDGNGVKGVFPQVVPTDAKDISFHYNPAFLQGGEEFKLSYSVTEEKISEWTVLLEGTAEWIGSNEEWHHINNWDFYDTDSIRYHLYWDGGFNHGEMCYVLIDPSIYRITFCYEDW